jgi:hypothetical protein
MMMMMLLLLMVMMTQVLEARERILLLVGFTQHDHGAMAAWDIEEAPHSDGRVRSAAKVG